MKIFAFILLFSVILLSIVIAHEEVEEIKIDEQIREDSVFYVYLASSIVALVVICSLYASKHEHYTNRKKTILFLLIVIPVILTTVYLVGATIYLNSISHTEGPVHWHADYEIYACGNKITMKEPEGLSNKVGTEVFHHHGDNRIHVEGVVVDVRDVSLHEFFEATFGELEHDRIVVPTNEYVAEYKNGDKCNGDEGVLQVFLLKTIGREIVQEKLSDFEDYVISPFANVPPGDCIIIEFDKEKEKTTKLCETYRIAVSKGDLEYGS